MRQRSERGWNSGESPGPNRRPYSLGARRVGAAALAVVLVLLSIGGAQAGVAVRSVGAGPLPAGSPLVDNLSVNATSLLSFVPNQLTVYPGALVHLVVIQLANFAHTFVLSPVANVTIPTNDTPTQLYAFFNLHPPLVNLSLPATVGARVYANFTAPPVGSYEFVCEIPGHFQGGMYGELVSTTSSSGGSSSSPLLLEIGVGVIVVIAAALVAAALLRRRARRTNGAPPGSGPNP